MIHSDGCDHTHIGRHGGGGIQAAAHAGFQHDEFAAALAEPTHGQRKSDLEKRGMRVEPCADRPQLAKHGGTVFLRNLPPGNLDALAEIDQVRRGEQARAASGSAGNAVDHRTGAALAIGARHVDHLGGMRRIGEVFTQQASRAIETQLDPEHLGGKQPVDRLAVIHPAGGASDCGAPLLFAHFILQPLGKPLLHHRLVIEEA